MRLSLWFGGFIWLFFLLLPGFGFVRPGSDFSVFEEELDLSDEIVEFLVGF